VRNSLQTSCLQWVMTRYHTLDTMHESRCEITDSDSADSPVSSDRTFCWAYKTTTWSSRSSFHVSTLWTLCVLCNFHAYSSRSDRGGYHYNWNINKVNTDADLRTGADHPKPPNWGWGLGADLDSRLAYPRPRPRLWCRRPRPDSRFTRPILEVHDWDGQWQTKRLKKSWQAENPAYG